MRYPLAFAALLLSASVAQADTSVYMRVIGEGTVNGETWIVLDDVTHGVVCYYYRGGISCVKVTP